MDNSLTFTEIAFVVFYWVKIALTFGAVLSHIFWKIYRDFILQVLLPLENLYLTFR